MIELPELIRTYWYAVDWDVPALWALDLPTTTMDMTELAWHLDAPVWNDGHADYALTPRMLLATPERYPAERLRLDAADLAYPIEVTFLKDRWLILDGIHRLAKAYREGRTQMHVRQVPAAALAPWQA